MKCEDGSYRTGSCVADAGYGEATEFRDGLEKRELSYAVGIQSTIGSLDESHRDPRIPKPKRTGRSATAWITVSKGRSGQRGCAESQRMEEVRWREGRKDGWSLASVALGFSLRMDFTMAATARQRNLAAGGVARKENAEPTKYFLCDLPANYTSATIGANHQMPVEDRTRLSATQRRTRAGSLRGTKLERLAPPRHAGHAGPRLSDSETLRSKKNFWVDPAEDAS